MHSTNPKPQNSKHDTPTPIFVLVSHEMLPQVNYKGNVGSEGLDRISHVTQLFSSNQAAEVEGIHLIANRYKWFVVISSHLGDLHEKDSKTTSNEDFASHKRNFELNERNPFVRKKARTTPCASLRAFVSMKCISDLKCIKRGFVVQKIVGLFV